MNRNNFESKFIDVINLYRKQLGKIERARASKRARERKENRMREE